MKKKKKSATDLINVNVMTLKRLKAGESSIFFFGDNGSQTRLSDEIRLNGRDETAIPFEGAAAIVFHFSKTFTVQTDTEERKKRERAEAEVAARYNWFPFFFFSPVTLPPTHLFNIPRALLSPE